MVRRLFLSVLVAAAALPGADKTPDKTLELLREVGGLQEQIKALQKSLEGKLAVLGQSNAEQARAAAEQAAKAMTALGDRVEKGLRDQQEQQSRTLAVVAGLGSQLQAVTGDVNTLREAMTDLTASLTKLSTKVSDLGDSVKVALAPKPEPPQPEISATDLFSSAEGDRLGGKLDLAAKEYTEYVSKFGATGQAPDAQYQIGSIHYSKQEWDDAVKAFDVLLQNYPDSRRVPEALFYKGDSLNNQSLWPEANETFKDLRKRFPNHPTAKKSLSIKPAARF